MKRSELVKILSPEFIAADELELTAHRTGTFTVYKPETKIHTPNTENFKTRLINFLASKGVKIAVIRFDYDDNGWYVNFRIEEAAPVLSDPELAFEFQISETADGTFNPVQIASTITYFLDYVADTVITCFWRVVRRADKKIMAYNVRVDGVLEAVNLDGTDVELMSAGESLLNEQPKQKPALESYAYTRFGSVCELVDWTHAPEWLMIRYTDGAEKEVHITDIRADGGLSQIVDYLNKKANMRQLSAEQYEFIGDMTGPTSRYVVSHKSPNYSKFEALEKAGYLRYDNHPYDGDNHTSYSLTQAGRDVYRVYQITEQGKNLIADLDTMGMQLPDDATTLKHATFDVANVGYIQWWYGDKLAWCLTVTAANTQLMNSIDIAAFAKGINQANTLLDRLEKLTYPDYA